MKIRSLLLSLAVLPLAISCGPGTPPEAATGDVTVSGRYDVKGTTVAVGGGEKRKIAGTVVLLRDGDRYNATFELKTTYPSQGIEMDADVIGTGEGAVDGNKLSGSAETQLVISSVPGIDTGFAFMPRAVTTRLISTSAAELGPDGSIAIEISNEAAEDQAYAPTRTRLTGRWIGDAGAPDVAAQE